MSLVKFLPAAALAVLFSMTSCDPLTDPPVVRDTLVVKQRKNIDTTYQSRSVTVRMQAPLEVDSGRIADSVFVPRINAYVQRRDTVHTISYPLGMKLLIRGDTAEGFTVAGGKARLTDAGRLLEFTGKVVIVYKGDSIFTDAITLDASKGTFSNDLPLTIRAKDMQLSGEGIELKMDFSGYEIKRVTTGIHYTDK